MIDGDAVLTLQALVNECDWSIPPGAPTGEEIRAELAARSPWRVRWDNFWLWFA